jgi:hypothetical protein
MCPLKTKLASQFITNFDNHRQRNSAALVKNDVGTMHVWLVLDQGTSYRKGCRRNFEKDSFNWKLEGLVSFLIAERDWKATNTLSTTNFSPNTLNQNFEIAICTVSNM